MQEIQTFIDSLNSYESMQQKKLYFIKESFESNDYIIHPNIIAQNWLVSFCFKKRNKDGVLI